MEIKIAPVVIPGRTNIHMPTSEPYHMRVEVDEDNKQIRIPVFNEKDELELVIIDGVSPFMGHPKVDGCCE